MNKRVVAAAKDVLFIVITSAVLLVLITNPQFFKSDITIASNECLKIIHSYKAIQEAAYKKDKAYYPIYNTGQDPAKTSVVHYYWKEVRVDVEEEVLSDRFKVTCKASDELRIPISWFSTESSEVQSQRVPSIAPPKP